MGTFIEDKIPQMQLRKVMVRECLHRLAGHLPSEPCSVLLSPYQTRQRLHIVAAFQSCLFS